MRCIFCKKYSRSNNSIEHIVPESLGNKNHTLPTGVVCATCNNYFSRKIEMPVLHSFRGLRGRLQVTNKKGRFPAFDVNELPEAPDYRLMSRFIGKIGLEALADRLMDGIEEAVIDKPELDELRSFVRFNEGGEWPFLARILYPCDAIFKEDDTHFEVLHEWTLLYTPTVELYIVVAIFGAEFALNLGGRLLDGYKKWLKDNAHGSPLYPDGISGYYTKRLDLLQRGLALVPGAMKGKN